MKNLLDGFKEPDSNIKLNQLSKSDRIRVLFLAATPTESARLQVDLEHKRIDKALWRSKHREVFDLSNCGAIGVKDFRRWILRTRPHIVHFAGHGKGTKTTLGSLSWNGNAGIILEEEDRSNKYVSGKALGEFFKLFKEQIECVFLNACFTEEIGEQLKPHISYVIGVNGKVSDNTAIEFAEAFYEGLGESLGVEASFGYAKASLSLESLDGRMFRLFHNGKEKK